MVVFCAKIFRGDTERFRNNYGDILTIDAITNQRHCSWGNPKGTAGGLIFSALQPQNLVAFDLYLCGSQRTSDSKTRKIKTGK